MGGDDSEQIVLADPAAGVYRKLVLRDGRLAGACLYGDTADGSWYFDLIRQGRPIGAMRELLMFGRALAEAAEAAEATARAAAPRPAPADTLLAA